MPIRIKKCSTKKTLIYRSLKFCWILVFLTIVIFFINLSDKLDVKIMTVQEF